MGSSCSHRPSWSALGLGLGLVVLSVASPARASNTGKPRVPPSFLGSACIETIDRAVDPVWSFDVGIPFEDTALTEDEPSDSRTFQFFALCRQPGPLEQLPLWVSAADADAAAMLDPTIELPAPGEPLDESAQWAGCVEPITTAAQRMPISCAATTAGVTWDITGVPAGAHAVWGYTYEPAENLWTPRDGVVRIIDGDDASAGPAVAFAWPLTEVSAGLHEGIRVAVCVSAMEGTTVTLAWAAASALSEVGDAAFQVFAEQADVGDELDVAFVPPESAEYEAVFLRAEAVDPQGRSFAAYTRARVVFLSGCDEPEGGVRTLPDACGVGSGSPPAPGSSRSGGGCEEGGSGGLDESGGDSDGSGTGDDGDTDASSSGRAGAMDDESGCGCRARGAGPVAWAWGVVLVALGRRRRTVSYSRAPRSTTKSSSNMR